jgi:hypothetical protein
LGLMSHVEMVETEELALMKLGADADPVAVMI